MELYPVVNRIKGILFRNYQPGDEVGLAEVFNQAFSSLGAAFLKTPPEIVWRYLDCPEYNPAQINIAVDEESGKIVGSVMGNVAEYLIGGETYKVGIINDVATYPGYNGKGIAHNLMKMALNHFIEKNADLSMLSADPNGFPRSKIYVPLGYSDIVKGKTLVYFTSLNQITKKHRLLKPIISLLKPMQIPYRINKNSKLFDIELLHGSSTDEFRIKLNQINSKNMEFFRPYTMEQWNWCRNDSRKIGKPFETTQILLKSKNSQEVIGGATIFSHFWYVSKLNPNLKIKFGMVSSFFVDENKCLGNNGFKSSFILEEAYKSLFCGIIQASKERSNTLTMFEISVKSKNIISGAISTGFFKFMGACIMLKSMKENIDINKLNFKGKPIFIDPAATLGTY